MKRLALLLALLSFPLSCASGPKHPYQTEAQLRRYKVWRGTEDPFVIRGDPHRRQRRVRPLLPGHDRGHDPLRHAGRAGD